MTYDLRTHLRALEEHGLLRRVHREVDRKWELSAIVRWIHMGHEEARRYAVLFERVKGHETPVVVGAIGMSLPPFQKMTFQWCRLLPKLKVHVRWQ